METKKGPFRNDDGSWSLKKILAGLGAVEFMVIAAMAVWKDASVVETVLNMLLWFIGILLGVKVASGGVSLLRQNGDDESSGGISDED